MVPSDSDPTIHTHGDGEDGVAPEGEAPGSRASTPAPPQETAPAAAASADRAFEHPKRIGPYQILRVIGEGGMGVVYEAQQRQPVKRRVALKMMKIGMDTKDVVGRFQAERQALAVMEHPGVAKILDAGVSESGRPYFVMEIVRGIRMDEYCNQQRLTIRQRLDLFISVCNAVQHAHQKGVIHRDLKPSNVLVTERDGKPHPKIIDFGIAKATGVRLTDDTVVTTMGLALGTLAYMSPEQAEMSELDVDTRTDVYSLGVMLYELLAGRVPIDPKQSGGAAFLAQLVVRDKSTPTFKKKLAELTPERVARVAEARSTAVASLQKELTGDLEWIVLKAMEKDRNRRYETANSLAFDLDRHLRHQPTLAHPPTAKYRIQKFVRRNRGGVAFAVTMVLLLASFAVSMSVQARRIALERDRAEQETAKAQAVIGFMESILLSADPLTAFGPDVTLLEAMDSAVARLEGEFTGEPEVDALAQNSMGRVYFKLGRYDQAERLFQEALRIRLEVLGDEHIDVAESLYQMSRVLQLQSNFDSAEVLLTRAVDLRRRMLAEGDVRIAEALTSLGGLLTVRGRYDEAENVLLEALSIHQALDEEGNGVTISDPINRLGHLHRTIGNLEAAERHLRDALAIRERYLPSDHPLIGESLNNLAVVLDDQGKKEEAASMYRRAITNMESTFGPDSDQVSGLLSNLALVLTSIGQNVEAEALYRRALAIDRAILGDDHLYVGIDMQNLGRHLCLNGVPEEGTQHMEATARIFRSTFEPAQWEIGVAQSGYGLCLGKLGRFEDGERELVQALRVLEAALPTGHQHIENARARLADLYEDWGRPDRADVTRR